jgi:hypothetical protein
VVMREYWNTKIGIRLRKYKGLGGNEKKSKGVGRKNKKNVK